MNFTGLLALFFFQSSAAAPSRQEQGIVGSPVRRVPLVERRGLYLDGDKRHSIVKRPWE